MEGHPRYRSSGETMIITDLCTKKDNLLWQQVDATTLKLFGKIDGISGIELLIDGMPVTRMAGTKLDDANILTFDLSDQISGRYNFRLLQGYDLLQQEPIDVETTSPTGIHISYVQTIMSQQVEYDYGCHLYTVRSFFNHLPPALKNISHNITVIKSSDQNNRGTKGYINFFNDATTQFISAGSTGVTNGFHLDFNPPEGEAAQINAFFGSFATIAKNQIYMTDTLDNIWPVAETINPLSTDAHIPPALYVSYSPTQIAVHGLLTEQGQQFGLSNWGMNTCIKRFVSSPNLATKNQYYAFSLADVLPQAEIMGTINLHTPFIHAAQLMGREISLTDIRITKVSDINGWMQARWGFKVDWQLPVDINNHLIRISYDVHFENPGSCTWPVDDYGNQYGFTYLVGRGSTFAANTGVFSYWQESNNGYYGQRAYEIQYTKIYLEYFGDEILLSASIPMRVDRNSGRVESFYHATVVDHWPFDNQPNQQTMVSNNYTLGDAAYFADTHTLWFYPIANINHGQVQYADLSATSSQWIDLAGGLPTKNGFSIPVTNLQPGRYRFRLKVWDVHNNLLDLSSLTEVADGWGMVDVDITHGAQLSHVSQASTAQTLLQPVERETRDRWQNVTSTTSAAGNEITYTYNARNLVLTKTQPEIEVTHEDGSSENLTPTEKFAYDLNSQVIAREDANGNITLHERAPDGTLTKTTRADGVWKKYVSDILGRTIKIEDALGHVFEQKFNHNNLIIASLDGCQWPTNYLYNERQLRVRVVNGNNETEYYDYRTPFATPTHHYQPQKQCTIMIVDAQGNLLSKRLPDGREMQWSRDYFGRVLSHTDLSGASYTYTYDNFLFELKNIMSTGGNHGMSRAIDGSFQPQVPVNITYQYDEASQLIGIDDAGTGLLTRYRMDIAGRRARETTYKASGDMLQAVWMSWNACGWLTEFYDTTIKAFFGVDANGNRRCTLAHLFWDNAWQKDAVSNWHTYSKANNLLIYKGSMQSGEIKCIPGKGMMLIYDAAGRRQQEKSLNTSGVWVVKTLTYLNNDLLQRINISDGTNFNFAYDGKVARRKISNKQDLQQTTTYNANGWAVSDHYVDTANHLTTDISYGLNAQGQQINQNSNTVTDDGQDGYDDHLMAQYTSFDSDILTKMSGYRHRMNGDTSDRQTVSASLDPNGNTESIQGAIGDEIRWFKTNSQGRIVEKSILNGAKEKYFYTSDDEVLGRMGNFPDPTPKLSVMPSDIDLEMSFKPVSENFPPPTPSGYLVQQGDTFHSISESVYGDGSFASEIAHANGYHPSDEAPLGMMLSIPSMVNTNNHHWQGDYAPYDGQSITGSFLPTLPMPGRPAVFVPAPPQRKHHAKHANFWHELTEVFVAAAVVTVGFEFAPLVMGAVFSEVMGATFATSALGATTTALTSGALAGGASNLAQQATSVVLKDQKHIAWGDVGKASLVSGMGSVAGSWVSSARVFSMMNAANPYVSVMEQSAETNLLSQGMARATGLSQQWDWTSVAASSVTAGANQFVGQYTANFYKATQNVTRDMVSVTSNFVVNDLVTHKPQEMRDVAAQALGTIAGNQAGNAAIYAYQRYEAAAQQQQAVNAKAVTSAKRSRTLTNNSNRFFNSRAISNDYLAYGRDDALDMSSDFVAIQGMDLTVPAEASAASQLDAMLAHERAQKLREDEPISPYVPPPSNYAQLDPYYAGGISVNTALTGLAFLAPIDEVIGFGVKAAANNLERWGLFGRDVGEVAPEMQLQNALIRSKVSDQLASIDASSPNAYAAIESKLSGLRNAQQTADITKEMPDGTIRYYDQFRPARNIGESSGSRFVTEFNPETNDVTMWNEVYDQKGLVNRIHLKNINGIEINSVHFPPTLKETLEKNFTMQQILRREF